MCCCCCPIAETLSELADRYTKWPELLSLAAVAVGADARVPVIVDTSGPALLRAADAGAAVLKPNAAELAEATGLNFKGAA
jgi:fructose-1-phosphate kinase PfkB-like protein